MPFSTNTHLIFIMSAFSAKKNIITQSDSIGAVLDFLVMLAVFVR